MIAGIFGQRSSDPSEKRIESLRQEEAAPAGGSRPELHGEGDAEGGLVQVVDGAAADRVEVGRGLVGVRHAVDLPKIPRFSLNMAKCRPKIAKESA